MPQNIKLSMAQAQALASLGTLPGFKIDKTTGKILPPEHSSVATTPQGIGRKLYIAAQDNILTDKELESVFGQTVDVGELEAVAQALVITGATEDTANQTAALLFQAIAAASNRVAWNKVYFKAGLALLERVGIERQSVAWTPKSAAMIEFLGLLQQSAAPKPSFSNPTFRYETAHSLGPDVTEEWAKDSKAMQILNSIQIDYRINAGVHGSMLADLLPPQRPEQETDCEPSVFWTDPEAKAIVRRFVTALSTHIQTEADLNNIAESIRWLSPIYAERCMQTQFESSGFSAVTANAMAQTMTGKRASPYAHQHRFNIYNQIFTRQVPDAETLGLIEDFFGRSAIELGALMQVPAQSISIHQQSAEQCVYRHVWRIMQQHSAEPNVL